MCSPVVCVLGVVASKKCAAAGSEAGVADLRKTGRLTAILISINTYDVVKNDYIYGPYTYKYKYIYIYIYMYIYILKIGRLTSKLDKPKLPLQLGSRR